MKLRTLALALVLSVAPATSARAAEPPPPTAAAGKIVIPKVDFREATVRETLEFLSNRAYALDPAQAGLNIILKTPVVPPPPSEPPKGIPGLAADPGTPPPAPTGEPPAHITLTLNNVPLSEVLKYIANLGECSLRWDPNAVVIFAPVGGKKLDAPRRTEVPIANGIKLDALVNPLQTTKIPRIDVREASVAEVFEFLQQQGKKLLPAGKVLNVVLKVGDADQRRVTFSTRNLSLLDALRYTAELADLEIAIDQFAVVVSDPKAK